VAAAGFFLFRLKASVGGAVSDEVLWLLPLLLLDASAIAFAAAAAACCAAAAAAFAPCT